MLLEATERIFNKLPLKEVRVNNFVTPEKAGNISSLLPGIGMMQLQTNAILQQK